MMLFLDHELKGKCLSGVKVCRENYRKKTKGFELLGGKERVVECSSKGKCGWICLDTGLHIVIGFGMTGGIRREGTKHSAVSFYYEDRELFFVDMRNFGHVWVLDTKEFNKKVSGLGPCILDTIIQDKGVVATRLRRRNSKTICEALLDQSIISGIGNYIKAEILYDVGVHPMSKVSALDDDTLYDLYLSARCLAGKVLELGGTTLYTYKDIDGRSAEGVAHLRVYGMSKDPEGRPVKQLKTSDGRTTHYVPERQTKGQPEAVRPRPVVIRPSPRES